MAWRENADITKLRVRNLTLWGDDGVNPTLEIDSDNIAGIEISGANTSAVDISGANTTAIDISVIQEAGGDWDEAALFKHGTYTTALAYGTITAGHTILKSTHITAAVTGHYLMADVNFIESSALSTGYFVGGYDYLNIAHTAGAAIARYVEVDLSGTAVMNGNVQGLYSEMIVAASSVITGAGKISGITVEMNVGAGATVAQPIHGIEVDMRDIRADIAGETIGIKVTQAGGSNYLDYGMQFSNCFHNATAIINFDLTQGNTACVLLVEAGAHTITSFATFTGATTYFADFNNSTDGSPFTKTVTEKTGNVVGNIKVLDQDGSPAYINVYA